MANGRFMPDLHTCYFNNDVVFHMWKITRGNPGVRIMGAAWNHHPVQDTLLLLHILQWGNGLVSKSVVPSAKGGWNPRTSHGGFNGKTIEINGRFSSKPCLMTPEGIYSTMYNPLHPSCKAIESSSKRWTIHLIFKHIQVLYTCCFYIPLYPTHNCNIL